MTCRSDKGFTLAEILIVLFIMGLAAGLAVVGFGKIHDNTLFREALRNVQAGARQARMLAIARREPVSLISNGNSFWIEKEGRLYGRKTAMPGKSRISDSRIVFFPKGDSSGGSVVIKGPDEKSYEFEVDRLTGAGRFNRP